MNRSKVLMSFILTLLLSLNTQCHNSSNDSHKENETAEENHGDEIELTEKQLSTVGIKLGSFSFMAVGNGIEANGQLEVTPQQIADVTPLINGNITGIFVQEGQFVKAGAVVAKMESLEISSLINEYKNARLSLNVARKEYERQKTAAAKGAATAQAMDIASSEVEVAENRADYYGAQLQLLGINAEQASKGAFPKTAVITSPISGYVSNIMCRMGEGIGPSQPVMTIVDNTDIFAMVKVYEKDLDKIKAGEGAEVSLINKNLNLKGKVTEIIRKIDTVTKTINVKISLQRHDMNFLLPGMAVSAYISAGDEERAALPEEAVVSIEGKDFIYVLAEKESHNGETAFIFRPVEVIKGNSRNGFVEVNPIRELPENAEIVVAKAFYLASMAADHGEHNH